MLNLLQEEVLLELETHEKDIEDAEQHVYPNIITFGRIGIGNIGSRPNIKPQSLRKCHQLAL